MTVGVVIPSKSNLEGLKLVHQDLALHCDLPLEVATIDNGYSRNPEGSAVVDVPGDVLVDLTPSIYRLWNHGWQYLWELSISTVVFLNDDIRLVGPQWIERLVAPLYKGYTVTCPDWTETQPDGSIESVTGTYRNHGMCGFAFAVDVHAALERNALPFDEDYSWWYGDDDFVERIDLGGGKIGRVGGLHIQHAESTTINKEDVGAAIALDAMRYAAHGGKR